MPDMLPTTWDLIRSGLLSTPKITGRRGIRRWLLTAGILFVLIPMGWFHRFCLALDHLLFPSFKAIEPKKPLFIIGPPRSGTTYLHRLIEKNPQFTTFYFWELLLAPAICQKRFWLGLHACDSRIGHPGLRCLRFIEQHCFSSMDDIHATSLMDAEEDYFGLLPLHACFLLIVAFPDCEKLWKLPQFDQWESSEDRDTVMNFYRGLLQRHLHVR
ncbi:MAG: sulfotransferase, partial [Planctomycetota bacterium]|nr:sulfotransferase [Planctomycetota bacterium]